MKHTALSRCALSCVAAAAFSGCGVHSGTGLLPIDEAARAASKRHVFRYTGHKQSFTVPTGVTQIKVLALGGNGNSVFGERYGFGARVSAVIPVTPGERLIIFVGGNASGGSAGYNGGARGGASTGFGSTGGGGGGGGATDVRAGGATLADRVLVAGGGGGEGGEGSSFGGRGGRGGTPVGRPGGQRGGPYYVCNGAGGRGGTLTEGGTGGAGSDCGYTPGETGAQGTLGVGGTGGNGGNKGVGAGGGAGGGGGGGFYGGGGGGGGAVNGGMFGDGGGGAGGSSYVEPSARNVRYWSGWRKPHPGGLVTLDLQ